MGTAQSGQISRAQGCLAGLVAGDALGSQVEFLSAERIAERYPDGVSEMTGSTIWHTLPGQGTDDTELAVALARSIVDNAGYSPNVALGYYRQWLLSMPFTWGSTITSGLLDRPNYHSRSNGALMRCAPIGIYGSNKQRGEVWRWATQDASMTHPSLLCSQAVGVFCYTISLAILGDMTPEDIYDSCLAWSANLKLEAELDEVIRSAGDSCPSDYVNNPSDTTIALQNALWQLLNAESPEQGIINTISKGGDTDTNAAIAGALLGAYYGMAGIPARWVQAITSCQPAHNKDGVHQPRPKEYWADGILGLAEQLLRV